MRRRLATLALIARLDDRRLKQAVVELAPLQARAAALAEEQGELDRRRTEESAVTLIEAMPYLGRFLASLRREMDRIDAEGRAVAQAVDAKRDEVLAAWRDLRSKEQMQDAILAAARHSAAVADQAELDERAIQSYSRRDLPSPRQAVRD